MVICWTLLKLSYLILPYLIWTKHTCTRSQRHTFSSLLRHKKKSSFKSSNQIPITRWLSSATNARILSTDVSQTPPRLTLSSLLSARKSPEDLIKHLFSTFTVTDDGKDVLFHLYIYFYLKYNAVSFSLLGSTLLVYPFILMTLFSSFESLFFST